MNLFARIRQWLRPQAMFWTPWELMVMRLGIATLTFWLGFHRALDPFVLESEKAHGLAKFVPLMWLLEPSTLKIAKLLALGGLLAFVAGWKPRWMLLLPILYGTAMGSLRMSKGDTGHSTNLYYMVLLSMWIVYLWKPSCHVSAMKAAILIVAASYFSSGIVKLKASRGRWIADTPNLAVHMVKSNLSDFYSKPEGEVSEETVRERPAFLAARPWLCYLIFGPGLLLELGAVILVLGRRWALVAGLTLTGMHLGVSWLMAIDFWSHLSILLVLCVLPGVWRKPKTGELPS
jgi:hypothetical protein